MIIKGMSRDVLTQKRRKLNTYSKMYSSAVSVVTGIIDTLTQTSTKIEDTIKEIDDYTKELACTANDLKQAKEKNDKVIKNFRALISE